MNADELIEVLKRYRIRHTSEAELQVGIARILERCGVPFEREVTLSHQDRIDFLVEGGLGVELKIKGSATAAARQLQRYAKSDRIQELVLLTSRVQVGRQLDAYQGKIVRVFNVVRWS